MTEREIPDGLGFLFGGMTDDSQPVSAPPALSEPEKPLAGSPASTGGPGYSSRREARVAAGRSMDAAAPAIAAPGTTAPGATRSAPAYDGIASLFPLLGDVTVSPVESPLPAPSAFDAILAPPPGDLATQAMPIAEVAAELATPVAPYVVPQSAPIPIVPISTALPVTASPTSASTVPPPSWHVAEAFGLDASAPEVDPFVASRRTQRAAPVKPTGRKKGSRPKRIPHEQADRHAWARGEGPKSSNRATPHRTAPTRTTSGRTAPTRTTSGRTAPTRTTSDRTAPARAGAAARKPIRQRIFGVGVMVAVGGLFAVLAIPAYADNNASALTEAAAVQTQKLSVEQAAASSVTTSSRDGYTATSAADLKKLYSDAIRQRNLAAYLQSGAKAQGDDYPWFAELSRNQGGGLSPLSYYYRECVDFVAWRLNRDVGSTRSPFTWTWSTLTPSGGNASQWKSAWLHHGWATGTDPQVGAVAWFPYNHVAYVSGILNNGQVLIEEYNQEGNHLYDTRVINAGDAYYLYAPPA